MVDDVLVVVVLVVVGRSVVLVVVVEDVMVGGRVVVVVLVDVEVLVGAVRHRAPHPRGRKDEFGVRVVQVPDGEADWRPTC